MAAITATLVKDLREKTGAGMMDCKKALVATDGDMEKAIEFLREKGLASSAKKADRVAAEGAVATYVAEDGKKAAIAEVNCETDFVAKNEQFQSFAREVAQDVAEGKEEGLAEKCKAMIANIGENIVARRYEVVSLAEPGRIGSYIHMGGKIGVLVVAACSENIQNAPELDVMIKDVAMQIAAANPSYLNQEEVPADVLEKEKEIYKVQAMNAGKPEAIAEKIVLGKIQSFYKEVCLVDQPFVKDDKLSVKAYCDQVAKQLGGEVRLVKFIRFVTGEGIEKKQENFAEEIAKQISDAAK